jgi:hypothetical protein
LILAGGGTRANGRQVFAMTMLNTVGSVDWYDDASHTLTTIDLPSAQDRGEAMEVVPFDAKDSGWLNYRAYIAGTASSADFKTTDVAIGALLIRAGGFLQPCREGLGCGAGRVCKGLRPGNESNSGLFTRDICIPPAR